jgi:hypothetical protein
LAEERGGSEREPTHEWSNTSIGEPEGGKDESRERAGEKQTLVEARTPENDVPLAERPRREVRQNGKDALTCAHGAQKRPDGKQPEGSDKCG